MNIEKAGTGIALALALTACAPYTVLSPPSPALCRSHGVAVADSDAPTGQIIEYNLADSKTVNARCQRPFGAVSGCAIPINQDQYIIWSIDDTAVRTHETCHAIYQAAGHTGE
jgi:hypothetical protein